MLRRQALKCLGVSLLFGALSAPMSAQVSSKLPVTIYYSLPASSAKLLDSYVAEFQATHPYLEITSRNFARPAELYKALSDPAAATPTMAIVETSWLPGLVQNQPNLYPVETWMNKEQFGFSWAIKNNAYVPLWEASQVNGVQYALPYFFTTKALIYNSEVLARAKIKSPPVTWDQVLTAAKKIADPKASQPGVTLSLGSPDNPGSIARNLQVLVWQYGGDSVASPSASAATPTALQNVVDYLKKINPPVDAPPIQPVGMYIGNVDDYLTLRSQGLPVKTAPLPGFDKNQRTTETQCWALTMYKNVPERELYKVQELAFFMLDFPQQRRLAEETPFLAAHQKVFDNPFYRQARSTDHANLRVFLNSVGKAKVVDTSGGMPDRYAHIGKMLGSVLRGEKTVSDLLPAQTAMPSGQP